VVALIAECHLNPHAAQQTKALLARTRSAQLSIVHARRRIGTSGRRIHLGRWHEERERETAPWHFL